MSEPPAVAGGFMAKDEGDAIEDEPFIFNSIPFILHPSAFILALLWLRAVACGLLAPSQAVALRIRIGARANPQTHERGAVFISNRDFG